MDWKKYVYDNLPPLALGPERELEMTDEMAQHLESVYEEALADGATEQDALSHAKAHIKDWQVLESELIRSKRPVAGPLINNRLAREARMQSHGRSGGYAMGSLAQDLRYGVRMLLKSKAFTAVAVLSLALGIGANTAIFSLIDAVLLKTLPVKKPNELVLFDWLCGPNFAGRSINGTLSRDEATGQSTSTSFSIASFNQFRDHAETLSDVFAFAEIEQLNINVDGQSEIASGQFVSGGYYAGLGVPAVVGRTLTNDDDQETAKPTAVISHRYWQRRFGMDAAVVGKTVTVNSVPFTIVGVTPRRFEGTLQVGSSPDFSLALSVQPQIDPGGPMLRDHGAWWVQVMGRLKPGATIAQTRAGLEGIFQQSALEEDKLAQAKDPATQDQAQMDVPTLRVGPGSQGLNEMRRDYAQPLTILVAVVGLVLLIACANVANLLLARGATRQREMAVRLALGAGRRRLIRQMLTESVLLAVVGGAVGVVLANWGKDLLLTLRPWGSGALDLDLKLDLRVLAFTAAVSMLTGILFGVAPALRTTRVDLTPALKDNGRGVIGGTRFGLTKALVIAQVALSLVLLAGAGLFIRTLRNLNNVDIGFNSKNVLLFRVSPRLSGYKPNQIVQLYEQMLERIEAVPGVLGATISRHPLLSGSAAIDDVYIEGQPAPGEKDYTYIQRVRPNFLETMEIPLLLGRSLKEQDDERAPMVAVINQAMAHRYFSNEDPIGKRFGFRGAQHSRDIEIVGVARDAKYTSLRGKTPPTVYFPYRQQASSFGGQMNFEVRTAGDPTASLTAIREAVSQVDRNVPLFDVKTQERQAEQSLAQERLFATLSGFFGVLALLLVCIGLYGVMSYAVARRTNEIGIRMALGATAPRVIRMVMRETMLLVVIGVLIGLVAAIASTRLIEKMLFGLTPTDPFTMSAATLLLIAVAALAGYLPARRASKVDPMIALRYE